MQTKEEARKYQREWYKRNQRSVLVKNKAWSACNTVWYSAVKALLHCVSCGEGRAAYNEFHHLDKTTKVGNIGYFARTWSAAKTLIEMRKCIILCRICHRAAENGTLIVDAAMVIKSNEMLEAALSVVGLRPARPRVFVKRPKREYVPRRVIPAGQGWCNRCKSFKGAGEFPKNRTRPRGLGSQCKTCKRDRYEAGKVQVEEHFLGKEEAGGSIPLPGSKSFAVDAREDRAPHL